MKRTLISMFALSLLSPISSIALAAPLDDVVTWCTNETGAPTDATDMAKLMPDGKPRGTRTPATLTAEARNAKNAGDCNKALEWMLACVEHDEGAKNVLRADPAATCAKL